MSVRWWRSLLGNRNFRLAAQWSLDHLSPGVETSERRLVEAVDRALVQCAATLAESSESLGQEDRETLELVASRPWFDLVCPEEFFHAQRGLHFNESHTTHSNAFGQRELRVPLGDYVARSMFARVDYWKAILDRLGNEVSATLPLEGDNAQAVSQRLLNHRLELELAVDRLAEACKQEQQLRRREACTALTLVYAAYAPQPDLDWLGFPPGWGPGFAALIRSCIRRQGVVQVAELGAQGILQVVAEEESSLCDPDTVRQVAGALHDVTGLYEVPEDPDDLIDWAQDYARLVIVDRSPREVFWEGKAVNAAAWDKYSVPWNLLWVLAHNPRSLIDQGMLQHPDKHTIRSRRARLSELLVDCQELDERIATVRGHGYRLDLDADDVILLQDDGLGQLQFVGGRQPARI